MSGVACPNGFIHVAWVSLICVTDRRQKTTNMQPQFWLFTSWVLWHSIRLYTEGNPIIGTCKPGVFPLFWLLQWSDFDGHASSSVQQCLFGDQFTFWPHLFDIIGFQKTFFDFKALVCAFGRDSGLSAQTKETYSIISQSSSGCISPPFNQADDGSRNEDLPRLFASEINIQRMLQDAGDTNDAFYWRDKRGLEVEQEKFEELSSCWKNSGQPSNYSPEPLHRMEMNRVNINKRFPPWNMTGPFFFKFTVCR